MSPEEAYKNKIGERIARTLADALSADALSEEEARNVADYVLSNIDKAQTSAQVMDFLTELAHKWQIFGQLLTIELGGITEQKEDQAIEKTKKLLHENNIDEALNVAEKANEESQKGVQNG